MNGSKKLLEEFSTFSRTKPNDIILCPPFTLLGSAKSVLPDFIKIGAQNCSEEDNGAFTGEISATMLRDSHVSYVIIGHSETREENDNKKINLKIKSALNKKLNVIFCIGEKLIDKKKNKTKFVLKKQLLEGLKNLNKLNKVIIAYEPVWSIGTGIIPTEHNLIKNVKFIKDTLKRFFRKR